MTLSKFYNLSREYANKQLKEEYVPIREIFSIDKKDIIIFSIDLKKFKIEEVSTKKREIIIPFEKTFIEIPEWQIKVNGKTLDSHGGILIYTKIEENRKIIKARTLWKIHDNDQANYSVKPLVVGFLDGINTEQMNSELSRNCLLRVGSCFQDETNTIRNELGLEESTRLMISEVIKTIVISLLVKIEKKEYTTYKKWYPFGEVEKEIVYASDVKAHKRHFWEDSGKFIIPTLSKKEILEKGYLIDEVVFKNGELRMDVPYRIIGTHLNKLGKQKGENNRIIEIERGRILRCEEKIYKILRELYPDKIIRRHDRKTLKGIELDFNLPELRLGIEYDGEQHFDKELYEKLYGEGFEAQVKRDRLKDNLCRRKNIKLVRIKYDEPLTKTHIKKRLKDFL